jgi:hypothetical protein
MSIVLTPTQSIAIHWWLYPKRLLSWKDFCTHKHITPELCSRCGINSTMLCTIQPSLQQWIDTCGVSFADVPYMTAWPLHPFRDLCGYIPDLIQHKYNAPLLRKLGIDYPSLIRENMTIEWMKMFNFSAKEWSSMKLDITL